VSDPLVYIDRSDIRDGMLEDVRKGIRELVAFVDEKEPQLIGYSFYFNEGGTGMTVVAIHPDSASLELHLEIGGPAFRKLSELIELRTIDIYGRPSEKVLDQLQQKIETLGANGRVVVHQQQAGFLRFVSGTI
jgi:hypothetical protein